MLFFIVLYIFIVLIVLNRLESPIMRAFFEYEEEKFLRTQYYFCRTHRTQCYFSLLLIVLSMISGIVGYISRFTINFLHLH